jgi:F0F1-type ATP synthase assembly protein I
MSKQVDGDGKDDPSFTETDDRSAFAKAMDLASQVTAICMTLVVPALAGYFLDRWLGWGVVLTSLGLLFGAGVAGFQLVRLVRRFERQSASPHGTAKHDKGRDSREQPVE